MALHACRRVSVFFLVILAVLAATAPTGVGRADTPAMSEDDLRHYTSVLTLLESRQYERGLALSTQRSHPLADKIIRWIDLGRRNTDRDFQEIAAFIEANPNWPGLFSLYRNAELRMPQDLPWRDVVAWFAAQPPITGEGALRHVAALWDSGQAEAARAAARLYWVTVDFDAGDETKFHGLFKTLLTEDLEVERLERLLWDQRTTATRRQIQRVPPGPAALARARLALIQNRPGVDALIERVPARLRSDPGLSYERAVWRRKRGRFEGVTELLDTLPDDIPHAAAWWRLRNWVFWRALDRNDFQLAYRISAAHGNDEGIAFADGEWQAGWTALTYLNRPADALEHFQRLHDGVSSDISKSRGAFWAGEATAKLGRAEAARDWYERAADYPATFYGQLAAQRISVARSASRTPLLVIPAARRDAFESRDTVQAVRLLGQLGQPRLQNLFVARLRQDAEDLIDYRLIIELANDVDRHDLALRTAKSARRNGKDLDALLYPRRALPIGPAPEPALVLAVMRQESEFYPKARSPVGALGLMQLMPATARHVARNMGIPFNRARLTDDPDYNIRLGQAYLKELLERFDGSYILALAAYNAGPSRVESWIDLFGDPRAPSADPINWIERIPFSETRNYVQRILESLVVYRDSQPPEKSHWALQITPAGS